MLAPKPLPHSPQPSARIQTHSAFTPSGKQAKGVSAYVGFSYPTGISASYTALTIAFPCHWGCRGARHQKDCGFGIKTQMRRNTCRRRRTHRTSTRARAYTHTHTHTHTHKSIPNSTHTHTNLGQHKRNLLRQPVVDREALHLRYVDAKRPMHSAALAAHQGSNVLCCPRRRCSHSGKRDSDQGTGW